MIYNKLFDLFLPPKLPSLWATGNKLMSYNTCIIELGDTNIIFNITKYSTTTSRKQNKIKKILDNGNLQYITVDNIPINTKSLKEYINH